MLRYNFVAGRENEFRLPVLIAAAEKAGLAARYVRTLNDLRRVNGLLGALDEVAFGRNTRRWETSLQRPDFDSVKLVPDKQFELAVDDADIDFCKSATESLASDPRAKIELPRV